ncbi:ATP-dependent protease LonB [Caldanaerobius polysaccharolyticus]|nr:ATP-dependent protease LonB [Caldanaerobius polysaccharolyticus]
MIFISSILLLIELVFAAILGLYLYNTAKGPQYNRVAIDRESKKEMEKLNKLRHIHLTEPLAEKTRPQSLKEIVGQEEGIKALKAALCGPNPQHVLIYGPPGVGKTAAARLVLEEAKANPFSPFKADAKFVEMDATTLRFDERGIADPLMGSVHDPIYQGAGPLGIAGIPQPKPGAVTRAHGGILFIDEIGELHPVQMNKLLKVLEDRKVFLESAYYNSEDTNIPRHIHDIFQNGLPADFRLVGATTRSSEEIPPALRSRCVEVYFRELTRGEVATIAENAAKKGGFELQEGGADLISRYAANGREAVNMVQLAGGLAITEGRSAITLEDIEWVINNGHYNPRPDIKVKDKPQVGCVNGLAVYGPGLGALMEIEVTAKSVSKGSGRVKVTGIIDEEEICNQNRRVKRKSAVSDSIENVMTVLKNVFSIDLADYDVHVNFPGGIPVDGPSAGIAITTAVYSAVLNRPVDNWVAMTGEISIRGEVKPVGGVVTKINAAKDAGVKKVIIPHENFQETFAHMEGIEVMPVKDIREVIKAAIKDDVPEDREKVIHFNTQLKTVKN